MISNQILQSTIDGLKSIIMNIDKNAFFLVTDIREVFGNGFTDK